MAVSLARKAEFPSIFDADSEEETDSDEEYRRNARDDTGPSLIPLQEAVSEVPRTFQDFLDILLPRIRPNPDITSVSLEDQQSLVNVVCGEIANQFSNLQLQSSDPFLSAAGNKEFHRKIIMKVIGIIEDIYSLYITKACGLSKDVLFSVSSGMSRLRAQLSVDLNRSINLVTIRRKILEDINGSGKRKIVKIFDDSIPPHGGLVRAGGGELGKPLAARINTAEVKRKVRKLENAVKLDVAPPRMPRIPQLSTRGTPTVSVSTHGTREVESVAQGPHTPGSPIGTTSSETELLNLQQSTSMPELRDNFLFVEMRPKRQKRKKYMKAPKEEKWGIKRCLSVESLKEVNILRTTNSSDKFDDIVLGECTLEQLNNDLRTLASRATTTLPNSDDLPQDLPPLLLARGHGLSEKKAKKFHEKMLANVPNDPKVSLGKTVTSSKDDLFNIPQIEEIPPTRPVSIHTSGMGDSESFEKSQLPNVEQDVDEQHSLVHTANFSSDFPIGLGLLTASGITQSTQHQLSLSLAYQSMSGDHLEHSSIAGSLPSEYEPSTLMGSNCTLQNEGEIGSASFPPGENDMTKQPIGQQSQLSEGTIVTPTAADNIDKTDSHLCLESPVDETKPEMPEPQPDVVRVVLPNNESAMVSDICVSERKPWSSLNLQSYGPICEGLKEDLSQEEAVVLDQAVKQGNELHHVYEAIGTTLQHDHMEFDSDSNVLSCMEKKVCLDAALASSTLCHRHSRRIVNPSLQQSMNPPWWGTDKEEWLSSQYHGTTAKEVSSAVEVARVPGSLRKSRANKTLWQSTINTDDFFRFVMSKQSDYLGLVYHLYDSDCDSEEEEKMEIKRKEEEIRTKRIRERKKVLRTLQHEKDKFDEGFWNTRTITMGGLGQPPTNPFQEVAEQGIAVTPTSFSTLDSQHQLRLSSIWNRLQYPETAKMDMAVKYTSEQYRFRMDNILGLWEKACEEIENRESVLLRLEKFEETASRPNRFFKGPQASAAYRLQEARERAKLLQELEKASKAVAHTLNLLKKGYSDVLLFKGLPYSEKMKKDQTEMLYCLQQDRRVDQLQRAMNE